MHRRFCLQRIETLADLGLPIVNAPVSLWRRHFKHMLTGKFKEGKQQRVTISGVASEVFQSITSQFSVGLLPV